MGRTSVSRILVLMLYLIQITAARPCRKIFQYATPGTWFENAAVRRSGSILLTSLNYPGGLHTLNPFDGSSPVLVTDTFDGLNSTLGIIEAEPDTFYVLANNFSLEENSLGVQPGTNAVFKVVFNPECDRAWSSMEPKLVTRLPEAEFLNGLTKFNDTFLLAADSGKGVVWGINPGTGSSVIVAKDPLMAPVPVNGYGEGINGVHCVDGTLYFSNSQKMLLAKVDLDHNGLQAGPAIKIASSKLEGGVKPILDDFAIDEHGDFAYVATENGNSVQRIDLESGEIIVFAGNVNSTVIAEPTSTVFGRTETDGDVLYVMTSGGLGYPIYVDGEPERVGAQVVAVHVGK